MTNVFIAWSKEIRAIADKLSEHLKEYGLSPVVGGENAETMMVNEQVINHMKDSEMAILLIEKNISRDKDDVSGNIMFEWGYLLHKLKDACKIQVILINMKSSELPTDVAGCYVVELTKNKCNTDEEKEAEFERLALEAYKEFTFHYEKYKYQKDKLLYIDTWEEEKHRIMNFDNNERIAELLLFGMQATIYSGQYERLYKKINSILETYNRIDSDLFQVMKLCSAILNVFILTKRLTQCLDNAAFGKLKKLLFIEYETKIADKELAAWCKIFRLDKIELCIELYAAYHEKKEYKIDCYIRAAEICKEVIGLLDKRVAENPNDTNYALLYYSFAYRNLYLIYNQLNTLNPSKEYYQNMKDNCKISWEKRQKIYEHYLAERNQNCVAMDYITQEYVLSLGEQMQFETDEYTVLEIKQEMKNIYDEMAERNRIRNMIFDKIACLLNESNN